MKILVIILFFLLLGAFFIVTNNNLALIIPGNADKFIVQYSGWFSNVFQNFKNITAFAVKLSWLP
jgi:calcineurin-like phosphoesterase family protein